jgi:phosphatidylserine/phosphatidylglycerophosphate/cardiolipin synthase-like enzyme
MRRRHPIHSLFGLLLTTALAACGTDESATSLPEAPDAPLDEGRLLDGKADGNGPIKARAPLPEHADFERPLQALFAPDDPVTTLELRLIDTVVSRRAEDAAEYAEGENPFRIRYAVYNLRNPDIVAALISAEQAGVDVQILIEDKQLDPARTWNTADETLIEAGFEFVPSHRDLTPETARTADLIGIEGSGLMHLKARLFKAGDWAAALSGSMNPGDNAVLNEETLHLIRDPALIDRYTAAYEAVRAGKRIDNVWDDAAAVNVLFTPAGEGPRAGARLIEWLQAENEQILLMVFSVRDVAGPTGTLVDVLIQKAQAGVPVYLITDRKQSDGVDADGNPLYRNDRTEDRLRAGGVHVYEATNRASPYTAMHHKVGILGRSAPRIVTDAANWSFSGLGSARRRARNTESVLFIDTAKLDEGLTGRRYLAQWMRVLQRYAHQSTDDGEPSAEAVIAALTDHPDWPTQAVRFDAEVETDWGEQVDVRGDLPALGKWFADGAVALYTDGDAYPWWQSGPVKLPLGTTFEYKLTASLRGAVRWESGENRTGAAIPAPLQPLSARVLRARWR